MKTIIALSNKMAFKLLKFCSLRYNQKSFYINNNYAAANSNLRLINLSINQNTDIYKLYTS